MNPAAIRNIALVALLLLFAAPPFSTAADEAASGSGLVWEAWSPGVFARAKKENKLVLLDLEAVWCHWCHVMAEKTYANPEVARRLRQHFILIKVDQDSRPDISHHYEDYGWPATVFYAPAGAEIAIRSGYIPPEEMIPLLDKLVADPKPESGVGETKRIKADHPFLSDQLRQELKSRVTDVYDHVNKGWGSRHKFLSWENVEYCLLRGRQGDAAAAQMAHETLAALRQIIDPVWGGLYQYSTDGDWNHPHFEKIMSMQSDGIKAYALAALMDNDPADLQSARQIERYLHDFLLSPEGAFFTSQDADLKPGEHSGEYFQLDDAQRRKQGVPRIDRNIYARENGWAIDALASLYAASGDEKDLAEATRAADWIIAHRSLPGGGFTHGDHDSAGPYLGDSLAMGRAFLSLYAVTADRQWLDRAEKTADFIRANFQLAAPDEPGFVVSRPGRDAVLQPQPNLDENVALARFSNLLFQYTGNKKDHAITERAMRFVASPQTARDTGWLIGHVLMADAETTSEPQHLSVVGGKTDPVARALFHAALQSPDPYHRIDWIDPTAPPLPNLAVEYPPMNRPALFSCSGQRCSAPVFNAADVSRLWKKRVPQ